jgi:hypothetical protein
MIESSRRSDVAVSALDKIAEALGVKARFAQVELTSVRFLGMLIRHHEKADLGGQEYLCS